MMRLLLILILASSAALTVSAFASSRHRVVRWGMISGPRSMSPCAASVGIDDLSITTTTVSNAVTSLWEHGGSSIWTATIDSDIANIPTNEFAPVFAGGILVMLGGVISSLVVGLILEKKNLYANVVAESYVQGSEDESFWKGLSEEEKKKAQEILQKVQASKDGGKASSPLLASPVLDTPIAPHMSTTSNAEVSVVETGQAKVTVPPESKNIGMFSDYSDNS